MPKQSLLGQVHSDQQQFAALPATVQMYSSREVGAAGGVAPSSNFTKGAPRASSSCR